MTDQANLFEPHKLHRKDDPITSHLAAEQSKELRGRHWLMILEALRVYGPGTSEQIAGWTGLTHWAITRRMGELRDDGRVIQTQEKRKNKSGRLATVWAIVHTVGGP